VSGQGPFAGLDISNSGLGYNKVWLDTIADNIANVNTTVTAGQTPFRARIVNAMALPTDTSQGGGVAVASITEDADDPSMEYDPGNPIASADGYVAGPVVDLSEQMGNLILASRSYQMNMTVFKESRDALETTTTLGRG
jgi:flagellar basal-body rod protein FlgC